MIIRATEKLREADSLYHRIKASVPANDVEKRTRELLLDLARSRRDELRREIVKSRIKRAA